MKSSSLYQEAQDWRTEDQTNIHHLNVGSFVEFPEVGPQEASGRTDEDIVLSIIKSGRVSLSFQPIFKLTNGRLDVSKFESFTVWAGESGRFVRPEAAQAIADRHGLTGQLLEDVLVKTFQRCADLPNHIRVTINLTQDQLLHHTLVSQLVKSSNLTGFDIGRVIFEVSEKMTVSAIPKMRARLKELKMLGASIALDDFGICAAGMSILGDLPLDIIKFDKSLLHGARNNKEQLRLLNGLATLFNQRFETVVFEGVETKKDFSSINKNPSVQYQGFYFGKILRLQNLRDYVFRRDWSL
ncbi:EAL domain-containing protein [uncultured Erythrobacter sp.]|uniref:EAL domain-containing protein n=1 Tax=uncultured Erythrobacter sp. TaxID=263913 RepID=UPI00262A56F5|nr:EAL domain-containing protein [uncultured Erythrobacter sp.]